MKKPSKSRPKRTHTKGKVGAMSTQDHADKKPSAPPPVPPPAGTVDPPPTQPAHDPHRPPPDQV